MTHEVWRPSPSLTGYIVSSHGRLMRIPYRADMPKGGKRFYGGYPHYGQWDGARYIHQVDGKTYKVHRLVCEAFHGSPPFEGAVVMHLNEDSSDNRESNLQWGTQKQNLNAPGFINYCRSRKGKHNPYIKGRKLG